MSDSRDRSGQEPAAAGKKSPVVVLVIVVAVAAVLGGGWRLYQGAQSQVNHVALETMARGVTAVKARAKSYRGERSYVGTIEPWNQAIIASQFVVGYLTSVAVRPGSRVKKGEALATIDCRHRAAAGRAVADHSRAIRAKQEAMTAEAQRIATLFKQGYASVNEAQLKEAEALRQKAEVTATRERIVEVGLEVQDCVLRAPFDGEVSERLKDPGGLARPGVAILHVVDRSILRIDVDVPESDYPFVAAGTKVQIHVLSTGRKLSAVISRRAPSADPSTRTVRFEVDVPDPERQIPVGTTARVRLEVGDAVAAMEIPLRAARIRGEKATVFTVKDGIASRRQVAVVGESGGSLFVSPQLGEGTMVVTEGRNFLNEGDKVTAKLEQDNPDHPPEPAHPHKTAGDGGAHPAVAVEPAAEKKP